MLAGGTVGRPALLEDENVAHARTAGADEVVETNWVGFSLVAHAVTSPGAAQVIESVAIAGANNLYVGPIPVDIALPMSFGDLIGAVKRQTAALPIGIRDPATGEETLNPPHDQPVEVGTELIYLSTRRLHPSSTVGVL